MREHHLGPLRVLSFDAFAPIQKLTSVLTTREGGKSSGVFDSLNLGLHVGDDVNNVLENRAMVAEALAMEPENLTLPAQVHGADIRVVGSSDRGKGAIDEDDAILDSFLRNRLPAVPTDIQQRRPLIDHLRLRSLMMQLREG